MDLAVYENNVYAKRSAIKLRRTLGMVQLLGPERSKDAKEFDLGCAREKVDRIAVLVCVIWMCLVCPVKQTYERRI